MDDAQTPRTRRQSPLVTLGAMVSNARLASQGVGFQGTGAPAICTARVIDIVASTIWQLNRRTDIELRRTAT